MQERSYSQVSQAEGKNGQAEAENGQTLVKKVKFEVNMEKEHKGNSKFNYQHPQKLFP